MEVSKTALERAFELARSGQFLSVAELRRVVSHEGYVVSQLDGRALGSQLTKIIRQSRSSV